MDIMAPTFVVIHGNAMTETSITSRVDQSPNEYVAGIVYGSPTIKTVLTGGKFVALCEWSGPGAEHTFGRMGSFSYGAHFTMDREVAIREFGAWVSHFAPTLKPVFEEV